MMQVESVNEIYKKYLDALYKEIEQYQGEEDLWKLDGQILNTAGNLVLHLVGNLNYFIGTFLGATGYVRDRDREFSEKNVPKEKLLQMIRDTSDMVTKTISSMTDAQLLETYPIDKFGEGRTNGYILDYLLAHLTYHLGQINYHRRLLASTNSPA